MNYGCDKTYVTCTLDEEILSSELHVMVRHIGRESDGNWSASASSLLRGLESNDESVLVEVLAFNIIVETARLDVDLVGDVLFRVRLSNITFSSCELDVLGEHIVLEFQSLHLLMIVVIIGCDEQQHLTLVLDCFGEDRLQVSIDDEVLLARIGPEPGVASTRKGHGAGG